MKLKVVSLFFTLPLIFMTGCEKTLADCEKSNIHIENRWYAENGGINYLEVKNKDRIYICETINNFSKGEEIVISHNYGYLEIFLSGKKTDMIFTYSNGVVYRVGVGKYLRNEELTKRILRLMYISKRCWVEGCVS